MSMGVIDATATAGVVDHAVLEFDHASAIGLDDVLPCLATDVNEAVAVAGWHQCGGREMCPWCDEKVPRSKGP